MKFKEFIEVKTLVKKVDVNIGEIGTIIWHLIIIEKVILSNFVMIKTMLHGQ